MKQSRLRAAAFLSLIALGGCRGSGASASVSERESPNKVSQVRIGYQKSSVLVLVKWRGALEKTLLSRGVTVQWAEFPTGPAVIEAINASQLDLGFVGEAPPIFGQVTSDALVYIATEPPAPRSEAIVVKSGSPIHAVRDLKGKTIAFNKGSNVQYLVAQALQHAELRYEDVKTVYLAPADARAAFESGTVDAWAVWDPYLASAEVGLDARVLANAEGLANNYLFYVGRRELAEQNPVLTHDILDQIVATDAWVSGHLDETASYLAPLLGIDPRAMSLSVHRATWGVLPIDDQIMASQQRVADTFLQLGLLSKPLRVTDALPKIRVHW
ncbi:MAG: aliphatic sulfonate ABC transporter substrate-binding protein [Pseudomonadota bacterium]